MSNPIQGFTEGRKDNKESVFGRFIDKFGSSLKDFFVEKVSIEEYLENFTKPLTTKYEAKKPKRLIANFDSDSEDLSE